jgi:hypothetical protein
MNPGKVVVAVGRALGKALVAGLGLELARLTTRQLKRRLGVVDDDDNNHNDDDNHHDNKRRARTGTHAATSRPHAAGTTDHDEAIAALKRENALLRDELNALRAEVRGTKAGS